MLGINFCFFIHINYFISFQYRCHYMRIHPKNSFYGLSDTLMSRYILSSNYSKLLEFFGTGNSLGFRILGNKNLQQVSNPRNDSEASTILFQNFRLKKKKLREDNTVLKTRSHVVFWFKHTEEEGKNTLEIQMMTMRMKVKMK